MTYKIICRSYVDHILILTELWHLLDVGAVAGHGAVLAAFLLLKKHVSSFCIGKSYLHFFFTKIPVKSVLYLLEHIIFTSNGLIKLTML